MAKYVLAAHHTLMTDYRNVPLAVFFSCIPADYWSSRLVFRALADPAKLDGHGLPIRAPYGLRKVEASLVRAKGRDDVVVADPNDVDRWIDEDTEVVGLHTMDPLGLGRVSMSFTMGGTLTPYTKVKFLELAEKVRKPGRRYKVVVGGPGAWQFDCREGMQESLGIDHIVHGETDHFVPDILDQVGAGDAPPVMRFTNATAPTLEQVAKIPAPAARSARRSRRRASSATSLKSSGRGRRSGSGSRAGSRQGARRSRGRCSTGRPLRSLRRSGPTSSSRRRRS